MSDGYVYRVKITAPPETDIPGSPFYHDKDSLDDAMKYVVQHGKNQAEIQANLPGWPIWTAKVERALKPSWETVAS
jgi:hypothetical protein